MNAVLKTSQLTKTYSSKQVVKELSMTIQQGDIYGFIGKNGAGKTTLIRMIAGLATPSSGRWSGKSGDHTDQSCFSGAIFPDKAVNISLLNGHRQFFYNLLATICFR